MRHPCLFALIATVFFAIGCSSPPSLVCDLDLTRAAETRINVVCESSGGSPGDVAIKQMAQDSLVRVRDFTAESLDGAALEVSTRHDLGMGVEARHFTERIVQAGDRETFRYLYTVKPGAGIGDDMHGHQGRGFGFLNAEGGLLSGRNFLLLPAWYASLGDVRIRFHAGDDWRVVSTVPLEDGQVHLKEGGEELRALVDGAFGLGSFDEVSGGAGGGALKVFARKDLDGAARTELVRLVQEGHRFLTDHFGPLGNDYSVILVPRPPGGTMALLPPSRWGQGTEIASAGPVQAYDLFYSMARAWTDWPGSPIVTHPDDSWLREALAAYGAVRAADAAGARSLHEAWTIRARGARQASAQLEATVPEDDKAIQDQRTKGTFLLGLLDAALARDGGAGLDGMIKHLRSNAGKRRLFELLPKASRAHWEPIYGMAAHEPPIPREWLPALGIESLPLTLESGSRVSSPPRRLHILITAGTRGMLEVCGCKARQLGGIARRETVRRQVLRGADPVFLVDLGDAYPNDTGEPQLNEIGRRELDLLLELMGSQGYAAAAIGHYEMLRGAGFFKEAAGKQALPYVNANLSSGGKVLAPGVRTSRIGGLRVAWVSALDPRYYNEENARFYEQNVAALRVDDALAAMAEAARSARPGVDLVFAIGSLAPHTVRQILERVPEVDGILSTEGPDGALGGQFNYESDGEQTLIGFHDRRLVYFATGDGRWMDEITLDLGRDGKIAKADVRHHALGEHIQDYPVFRARLAAFYDAMADAPALGGSPAPVASHLPARLKAAYVGARICQSCHEEPWRDWQQTSHASAFSTLVARHRNYAPRCVGCHVTGFGHASGYRFGDPLERLRHVQCEMCHGPGGNHAAQPTRLNIVRRPPRESCFECHTPEHSNMSEANFDAYYARTVHRLAAPADEHETHASPAH